VGGGRWWWWRTWRILEVTERNKAESALEARSAMRGKVWFPVWPHLLFLYLNEKGTTMN